MRNGFVDGCRQVLGLGGCFLKAGVGGQLLSTTAKDGNNKMYPVAWAVVEGENGNSWNWFITLLKVDLGITDGVGYTFISDQQKVSLNFMFSLIKLCNLGYAF